MAINTIEDVSCDKTETLSHSSLNRYKHGNSPAGRLVKLNIEPEGSISNLSNKHGKYKNNFELRSPYLKSSNHCILGDSVKLVSRVTEKRFVHKNGGNIMSSFPLAGNIYKANSDEFKGKQTNKKILKSVLTLPNNSAPAPQLGTVSDRNDSEYLIGKDDFRRKTKKRNSQTHNMRKGQPYSKFNELESQYCSDMDLQLDRSSTDTIKKCGDGKRIHKPTVESKGKVKEKLKPHDVWAILRNMNRFQFQTSPQLSEASFVRKRKNPKKRNNRNDMRVFETRRTEEIAYISSYKVDKSPGLSRCSSFDKVTVIDKNLNYKVGKEMEDKPKKKKTGKFLGQRAIKSTPKSKPPLIKRNNFKAITYINQKKNVDMDSNDKVSTLVGGPNYEIKQLNNNASDDLGYESKTTENDEDFTSCDLNTTFTTQASQFSQSKLSDNSGSSKAAAFTKHLIQRKVKPKTKAELEKQVNGITKVILCRGQNVEQPQQFKKIEVQKRNRQATMNPISVGTPQLTRTEINRQLNNYKFPVVILGKDQLRSTMHVVNSDHPQFDGLGQQMWPFMKSWYGIETRPTKIMKKQMNHNMLSKKMKIEEVEKKSPTRNYLSKPTKISDKIPKIDVRRAPLPLSEIINQSTQNQRKLKPIRQLKDRMLKLLYKNTSVISVVDESSPKETSKTKNNKISVDTSTDTQDEYDANNSTPKVRKTIKNPPIEKRPWAKAKWASDFIENVIKKIKSGTYYSQESINKAYNEIIDIEKKEIDVQTDSKCDFTINPKTEESTKQIAIPGFDNVLPPLEFRTMSINEVAVKHCGTNIMVHFDVTVPTNSIIGVKSDSSLIPIDVTKSLTKVFKCQTSILNAMLPAELCSLLPKMLNEIIDSGKHLELFTTPIDMPCLTTISEIPCHSERFADILLPTPTVPTILPLMPMAPCLRQLLNNGYFKKEDTTLKFHVVRNTFSLIKDKRQLAQELRPKFERIQLFNIESQLTIPLKVRYQDIPKPKILSMPIIKPIEKINTCTVLQPYPVILHRPNSMPKPFSLMNLFQTMTNYINNIGLSYFRMLKTDNNLAINMNMGKSSNAPNVVTLTIGNFKTESLNACSKYLVSSKICILPDTNEALVGSLPLAPIEKVKLPKEKLLESNLVNNNKAKRKGYVKLYRKCKSNCNISGEKVEQCTPLNRITNLDDFFQALGSSKHLSGIFDGLSGNKIMSSIKELKNWTTEINPRQALLLILLANKKETPNLLRFRPMILQGIAVKRITKAIELDMEIEVIERENLNGVSRFEGISYLPASVENQDRLYEELCWIAKNTASDYQKPFDHTSEKLLKALLEKRKQLNPSYLRVMARYVGLGLLKSPGKRQ